MQKIIAETAACRVHSWATCAIHGDRALPVYMPGGFSRTIPIVEHAGTFIDTEQNSLGQ